MFNYNDSATMVQLGVECHAVGIGLRRIAGLGIAPSHCIVLDMVLLYGRLRCSCAMLLLSSAISRDSFSVGRIKTFTSIFSPGHNGVAQSGSSATDHQKQVYIVRRNTMQSGVGNLPHHALLFQIAYVLLLRTVPIS